MSRSARGGSNSKKGFREPQARACGLARCSCFVQNVVEHAANQQLQNICRRAQTQAGKWRLCECRNATFREVWQNEPSSAWGLGRAYGRMMRARRERPRRFRRRIDRATMRGRLACSRCRNPLPRLRQSAGRPLVQVPKGRTGGKSGLHGHAVPDNIRREDASREARQSQGQCHREQTARRSP